MLASGGPISALCWPYEQLCRGGRNWRGTLWKPKNLGRSESLALVSKGWSSDASVQATLFSASAWEEFWTEFFGFRDVPLPPTYPLPFVLKFQKVLRVNIIPKRKLETPHGFRFWRLQSAKVDSQKTLETPHGLRFWRLQGAKVDSQKKLETPHGLRFWRLQGAKVDSKKLKRRMVFWEGSCCEGWLNKIETPYGKVLGGKVDSQENRETPYGFLGRF